MFINHFRSQKLTLFSLPLCCSDDLETQKETAASFSFDFCWMCVASRLRLNNPGVGWWVSRLKAVCACAQVADTLGKSFQIHLFRSLCADNTCTALPRKCHNVSDFVCSFDPHTHSHTHTLLVLCVNLCTSRQRWPFICVRGSPVSACVRQLTQMCLIQREEAPKHHGYSVFE